MDLQTVVQTRLAALEQERTILLKLLDQAGNGMVEAPAPSARRVGRRPLTAAQKKALSIRMKAIWAERKKAPANPAKGRRGRAVS